MRATPLCLVFLWAAAAPGAHAADVSGRLSTVLVGRQAPLPDQTASVIPLWGLLNLEVGDFNIAELLRLRVVMQGWGRLQLASNNADTPQPLENDIDLGLFYVEAQHRGISLKAGRMHVVAGVGRMNMIDGGNLVWMAPLGFTAQLYGGATVNPNFNYHSGDWQLGARLAKRLWDHGEIGVSFSQRRSEGELARNELGVDGYLTASFGRLTGYGVVDPYELRLVEIRLAASYTDLEDWLFTLELERVAPDMFLPRTSILSVFQTTNTNSAGGNVAWELDTFTHLEVAAYVMLHDDGWIGYRANAGATFYRDPAHRTLVGLRLKRLSQGKRGYLEGRAFAALQLMDPLRVSADLYGYWYDEPINDVPGALIGRANVEYDIGWSLRAVGSVSGGMTPWAAAMVEGMVRLAWGFDFDLGGPLQ